MIIQKRIALLLAAATLLPAIPAMAADYDPPIIMEQPDEYVPVEVGSGWYLRGDVGYIVDNGFRDLQRNLVGPFLDLQPFSPLAITTNDEKDTPILGSVGFGYHFNDFLRADLNVGMLPNQKFGIGGVLPGGCQGTQTTTVTTVVDGAPVEPSSVSAQRFGSDCAASLTAKNNYWTGLANGYIDLGTYAGLTPYIGAGIGLIYSKNEVKGSATCNPSSLTVSDSTQIRTSSFACDGATGSGPTEYVGVKYSERDYNLIYSAAAGFSYKVARNTSIDVGYQYMNSPDASYVTLDENGVGFGKGIDNHTVRVGLRYDLW